MLSSNTVLDYINQPYVQHSHYLNVLKCYDKKSTDSWTRTIFLPSETGKRLNMLFCILIKSQVLGLGSTYIPGEDNSYAYKISNLD